MEVGHFWRVCMTDWALSHSLMVYSPGNWNMPWNLSKNSLMRSSVDLIGGVFLGVGCAAGAWVGPGSWEVSWMTMTVQFILMTSVWEASIPTGVYLIGLGTRGARLLDDRPMKWSKEGYLGTTVGSELGVAHIKASWLTCFVNVIRIEVVEEMHW